jgi:branched-chain amino acid transport system permease protein
MKKSITAIFCFAAGIALLPFFTQSGVVLNFFMMALYATLLAQSWNILGGYGGQFSFGHAAFFGSGAYMQAIAQLQWGLNAWTALCLAILFSAMVGALIGAVSFRYGLKGSYFALVTLACAEILRITSLSVPFTGAGVGLMLPLQESLTTLQFSDRTYFLWIILALVCIGLLTTLYIQESKFGAYLQAIRDNEDAAQALGIDPFRIKLYATTLSAGLMGSAGAMYLQVFQYIDPAIAYGPQSSVEALVGAIVGGLGSLWGPVIGAGVLLMLSELTRNLFGSIPGVNMVIYGCVLVFIVIYLPRGLIGLVVQCKTFLLSFNSKKNF